MEIKKILRLFFFFSLYTFLCIVGKGEYFKSLNREFSHLTTLLPVPNSIAWVHTFVISTYFFSLSSFSFISFFHFFHFFFFFLYCLFLYVRRFHSFAWLLFNMHTYNFIEKKKKCFHKFFVLFNSQFYFNGSR